MKGLTAEPISILENYLRDNPDFTPERQKNAQQRMDKFRDIDITVFDDKLTGGKTKMSMFSFMTPKVKINKSLVDDPAACRQIMTHELIHACLDILDEGQTELHTVKALAKQNFKAKAQPYMPLVIEACLHNKLRELYGEKKFFFADSEEAMKMVICDDIPKLYSHNRLYSPQTADAHARQLSCFHKNVILQYGKIISPEAAADIIRSLDFSAHIDFAEPTREENALGYTLLSREFFDKQLLGIKTALTNHGDTTVKQNIREFQSATHDLHVGMNKKSFFRDVFDGVDMRGQI